MIQIVSLFSRFNWKKIDDDEIVVNEMKKTIARSNLETASQKGWLESFVASFLILTNISLC